MRASTIIFLVLASSQLHAQHLDTTEVKNGVYWIFTRGKNGRPIGEGVAYDTTGRTVGRETYRKGRTHGQLGWYHRNGKIMWTVPYEQGFRSGIAIQYDSLGSKIHSITFRKGLKHGPELYFQQNGRVHYRIEHRNGHMHGRLTSYHPNGRVEWTGGFRDGEMHGERVLRDSAGTLHTGDYLTTFPMGMGRYSVTCKEGRPQGKLIMQRNDSTVSCTGWYTDGCPNGEFLYYDRKDEVYRKAYFENGVFVRSTRRGNYGGHTPQPYEGRLPEER